jgi:hypothetical protein
MHSGALGAGQEAESRYRRDRDLCRPATGLDWIAPPPWRAQHSRGRRHHSRGGSFLAPTLKTNHLREVLADAMALQSRRGQIKTTSASHGRSANIACEASPRGQVARKRSRRSKWPERCARRLLSALVVLLHSRFEGNFAEKSTNRSPAAGGPPLTCAPVPKAGRKRAQHLLP